MDEYDKLAAIKTIFVLITLISIFAFLGYYCGIISGEKQTDKKWISYANHNDLLFIDGNNYRIIRLNKEPRLEE
jgi:hypothetical protein